MTDKEFWTRLDTLLLESGEGFLRQGIALLREACQQNLSIFVPFDWDSQDSEEPQTIQFTHPWTCRPYAFYICGCGEEAARRMGLPGETCGTVPLRALAERCQRTDGISGLAVFPSSTNHHLLVPSQFLADEATMAGAYARIDWSGMNQMGLYGDLVSAAGA